MTLEVSNPMTSAGETPRLIVISGPAAGEVFVLDAEEFVVGRDTANAVAIADPSLSRRHCAFAHGTAGWIVRDLGSFNRTFVNGEPVSDRPLQDGDRLRMGASEFLFQAGSRSREPACPPRPLPSTTELALVDGVYLERCTGGVSDSRAERDLKALVRLGTAVTAFRDREHLQRELLDVSFDAVPASAAAFIRIDRAPAGRHLVETRARYKGAVLPSDDAALDLAISQREAVLRNAPTGGAGGSRATDDAAITSSLAVPVLGDDLIAGVLYLVTSDQETTFDRQHLELVTAIAGIGSMALKHLIRLESLLADTERLNQHLGITHTMIGTSPAMQRVYRFLERVSPTDATVLITGETGAGKELAARAIHDNSRRASWPFVAINCAALTESLLESELFGHERGAFTGAIATKRGKLEVADRGTLFLDEIGELSPALQSKLLRVLQLREFERVGGTRPIKVDIRVVSATNRDLQKAVAEGRFRQDLLFRLNVLTLQMPALRDRREDIAGLAAHFAEHAAKRSGRRTAMFSEAAIRRLTSYDWPGNVRELENVVERAVVLNSDIQIGVDDLPEALAHAGDEPGEGSRFHAAVAETKRRVVLDAIDQANGRLTDAARLLGLHPNYLHRLLRNLKLRD